MQGWKQTADKKIILETQPYVRISDPNLTKVRLERCLITERDVASYQKKAGSVILGRNGVGAVSEVYEGSQFDKADRVVICSYLPCGNCYCCRNGNTDDCITPNVLGKTVNGVYSDFIDVPTSALFRLPESVSNEQGLFIEDISFALNILDALNVEKGEHLAIFSDTKLGIILAQLALYYSSIPILIQHSETIREQAKDLGVFYSIDDKSPEVAQMLFATTGGRMCEKVVYLSGSAFPLSKVFEVTANYGRVCLCKSQTNQSINVGQLIDKCVTVVGVNSPLGNFPTAINLLATKQIDLSCLIGNKYKFNNLDKAFEKITANQVKLKNAVVEVD